MRTLTSAFAAALIAGLTLPAVAADLSGPTGPEFETSSDRPAISWTGISIGVHGGYAWSDVDFPGSPAYPAGPPRPSLEGGLVGIQGAALWQMNSIVIGAAADVSFGNMTETVRDGNYLNETATLDRFGTVRGIFGVAMGRFMPYATAGLAWGDITYSANCPDPAAVSFGGCKNAGPRSYSDTTTMTGFVWGAGMKYAVTQHWSLGVEYLHTDFGDASFTNGPLAAWPATQSKITSDLDSVRATVDFKF